MAASTEVTADEPSDAQATPPVGPLVGLCGSLSCTLGEACEGDPNAIPDFAQPMEAPLDLDASVILAPTDGSDLDGGMHLDSGVPAMPPPDDGLPSAMPDAGVGPSLAADSFACRLDLVDGAVARTCGLTGVGAVGSPCASVLDCAPGLGCVGNQAAMCLPLCCDDDQSCASGTFCALRPLRLTSATEANRPEVPVCVPAMPCNLADPFPCPSDVECSCPAAQACTVVRSDGTTSCRGPGVGEEAEACPCAPGFFCSAVTQTCRRFCELGSTSSGACAGAECQASTSLPEGWGVCTGG